MVMFGQSKDKASRRGAEGVKPLRHSTGMSLLAFDLFLGQRIADLRQLTWGNRLRAIDSWPLDSGKIDRGIIDGGTIGPWMNNLTTVE